MDLTQSAFLFEAPSDPFKKSTTGRLSQRIEEPRSLPCPWGVPWAASWRRSCWARRIWGWGVTTHIPLEGIPRQEPACEGGGFMSLLHHNDGGLGVTAAGMGLEVLLGRDGCGFLLLLVGMLPNPEEDLWGTQSSGRPSRAPWPTTLHLVSARLQ